MITWLLHGKFIESGAKLKAEKIGGEVTAVIW